MASFFNHHLISLYLLLIYFTWAASVTASPRPKSLLLTISKDTPTSQYITKIIQRTPLVFVPLTLDLGTQYLWLNCGKRYVSSTYKPVPCGSPLCALANTKKCRSCPTPPGPRPGCNNNTCRAPISNPITNKSTKAGSEVATEVIKLNSSNGDSIVGVVAIPNNLFACAPTSLLGGLAKGVSGVIGFGRSKASFPTQVSSALKLAQIFAVCLPPTFENGFVFLGDGPYKTTTTGIDVDLRSKLTYTPLITNPSRPSEYFLGVQGIRVGDTDIPINKSLLTIDSYGYGGTTISLIHPYTTMETSIFKAVTTVFNTQLTSHSFPPKRIAPIAPFEYCYDPNTMSYTKVGVVVQNIDLVLQNTKKVWTIAATNSIVRLDNANCLGFLDGGKNPRSSIVIGGYQIQDNLLQFDRAKSRLGFSSALIYDRIRCSFFNFTTPTA